MTLGLVDTVDTVMGHISSNLQSREPHVSLTGSSSMAGSHYQIGKQSGVVGEKSVGFAGHWPSQCLRLTQQLRLKHHFLSSKALCKIPVWKETVFELG